MFSLGFTWRIGLTLTAGLEEEDGVEKRDLFWRLLDLPWPGVAGDPVARMLVLKTGTGLADELSGEMEEEVEVEALSAE